MATKKKGLPELSVGAPKYQELVNLAAQALDAHKKIADLTTTENAAKAQIIVKAKEVRASQEAESGNYIGLIRITDPAQTTVQVQFKILNGALGLQDGPTLDHHFGTARPELFKKDVVVTGVTDPDALIAELRAKGLNPWDYVKLTPKEDMHAALAISSEHVIKDEAYTPCEGFLATLNEIKHTLSAEAKSYLSKYLGQVLKPVVDLGKK